MIHKWILNKRDKLDCGIQHWCDQLAPEKRLVIILVTLALFSVSALYIFASAVYQIGKKEGFQIEVKHIRQLQLPDSKDSTNQIYYNQHGRKQAK